MPRLCGFLYFLVVGVKKQYSTMGNKSGRKLCPKCGRELLPWIITHKDGKPVLARPCQRSECGYMDAEYLGSSRPGFSGADDILE